LCFWQRARTSSMRPQTSRRPSVAICTIALERRRRAWPLCQGCFSELKCASTESRHRKMALVNVRDSALMIVREFRRGRTRRRRDSRSLNRAEDLTTSSSSLCAVIGRRISQAAVAAGIRGQVSKARSRFLTVSCPSMSCPNQRGVSGGVRVANVTARLVALAHAHAGHRGMPNDPRAVSAVTV